MADGARNMDMVQGEGQVCPSSISFLHNGMSDYLANCNDGNALISSYAKAWNAEVVEVFSLQLCIANILPSGLTELGYASVLQDFCTRTLLSGTFCSVVKMIAFMFRRRKSRIEKGQLFCWPILSDL